MKSTLKIVLVIGFTMFLGSSGFAQKKVKMKQADKLFGGINKAGERFDRFIGDVIFEQSETTIYSDSVHFYSKRNYMEAFGSVKITEGDSVVITAKKLIYEGDKKEAKLRENVVFVKKGQVTLYTDYLDYHRNQQEARYYNGGKLVDSTNVLTSKKGYYQVNTNMASFKSDVVGKNPDYTLESDTLQYNTKTNIVYFRGPTQLTDVDGNVFNYKEGQYDTKIKRSDLNLGQIETKSYTLEGDNLFLDDLRKYYRAVGNVEMISKEQDVIITGDRSFYEKSTGIAKVFGRALMKKIMAQDTMYLTADTLVAIESDDPAKKRLLAYKNVKIFKPDLQGRADSLAYVTADSIIYFYDDPVLWSAGNQMTADSINVEIANNTINKLNMSVNSFVISKDSIDNFNQIKGRSMVAHFSRGNIQKVDVNGNGESLFHALDETESYLVGINKIICSYMLIKFKENKADNISFYVKPEASFIPPHEINAPQKKLKDFNWREKEKPEKNEMLESTILAQQKNSKQTIKKAPKLIPDEPDVLRPKQKENE
ncbi:Organic solvent tolerance protein OstA [Fulvivirga sp. 29W222]|uniref:Organic solvent tolerance protein OstA n=1 Tax=Fulvivirga marina TaxID=2494733 RepID=A0A937FUU2_9BACT|nr:OstA-like protein [Fulvivirga marina]MBL6444912.1 Organic solvent tolerance protein OstA [Fulvivirga marina]